MHTVYLVGQITSNPETYQWREEVENYFAENDMVNIINPCDNKFNAGVLARSNGESTKFSKIALKNHSNVLVPKDRYYVKKSNWIFMNMNIYSPERPLLGSFFELAWSFDQPWTTVIGIHEDFKKDFQCNHPFVRSAVHTWVKDEMTACRVLEEYA